MFCPPIIVNEKIIIAPLHMRQMHAIVALKSVTYMIQLEVHVWMFSIDITFSVLSYAMPSRETYCLLNNYLIHHYIICVYWHLTSSNIYAIPLPKNVCSRKSPHYIQYVFHCQAYKKWFDFILQLLQSVYILLVRTQSSSSFGFSNVGVS